MKVTRTHAFAVPDAGLWLHPHELQALFGLPAWHLALFAHIVLRSDFKTGACKTSHGELINALTPDQPAAGRRLQTYTDRDIRRALDAFERARILGRDTFASQQQQALFLLVLPRTRRGVSAGKFAGEFAGGPTIGKRGSNSPGNSPPLSAMNSYPPTSHVDNVVHSRTSELQGRLDALATRLRRG